MKESLRKESMLPRINISKKPNCGVRVCMYVYVCVCIYICVYVRVKLESRINKVTVPQRGGGAPCFAGPYSVI